MSTNGDGAEIAADLFYSGHRMTPVRRALIDIFTTHPNPLSIPELSTVLSGLGLKPHRVTLLRELDFLKEKRVIHQVDFTDGIPRYEDVEAPHHHHAVCVRCKKIEDIELRNEEIHLKEMTKSNKTFEVINHVIEFLGICNECKSV